MPFYLLIISIYEIDNPMIKLVVVVVLMNTCNWLQDLKNILHFGCGGPLSALVLMYALAIAQIFNSFD